MQLVDTTLFFSPTSGGVKRYLTAKHAWLTARGTHRHSMLVPGRRTQLRSGDISTIAGVKLPFTFNYRLPLSPRLWTRMLFALEPVVKARVRLELHEGHLQRHHPAVDRRFAVDGLEDRRHPAAADQVGDLVPPVQCLPDF